MRVCGAGEIPVGEDANREGGRHGNASEDFRSCGVTLCFSVSEKLPRVNTGWRPRQPAVMSRVQRDDLAQVATGLHRMVSDRIVFFVVQIPVGGDANREGDRNRPINYFFAPNFV